MTFDGAWDIETEGWDTFVVGGIYRSRGLFEWATDEDQFLALLTAEKGCYWTWNGGRFDHQWLADRLRRAGRRASFVMAGSRVLSIGWKGWETRDAFALCPMSLAKASPIGGERHEKKTGLACVCGQGCGGYCAIRRGMDVGALLPYLEKDCRATLSVLRGLEAEATRCGFDLRGTIGSTSYRAGVRMVGAKPAEWPSGKLYAFARSAYYGGRCEVYRPDAESGASWDIRSAYPAALTSAELATGEMVFLTGERAARAWGRSRPGLYRARVRMPALFIPPLPVRLPDQRIVYPVGELYGVWPREELVYAGALGADMTIDRALVWSEAETLFAAYMQQGFFERERAKAENPALGEWHKWRLNSFTGKLGESPDKERVVLCPSDSEVRVCTCKEAGRCRCRPWRPIDLEGALWAAPFWRLPPNAHVQWAAQLTAWTRITQHRQLVADGRGGETAVYGDTDSCWSVAPRTDGLGERLGEWTSEGEFELFTALAPKLYRYRRGGKWVVRGKGLPGLTADKWDAFARGEPVILDRGVMGIKSAARAGGPLFRRLRLSRANRADGIHYGGRIRSGAVTIPQTLSQVRAGS